MDCVFVYGTLKEGFPNFSINTGIRIPGVFITKDHYPLYLVGENYVPWLMVQPERGERVSGQVFTVDRSTLLAMDRLEDIAEPDGYRRLKIQVVHTETLNEMTAFAYMKPQEQLDLAAIKLGPLSNYALEHASLYSKTEELD